MIGYQDVDVVETVIMHRTEISLNPVRVTRRQEGLIHGLKVTECAAIKISELVNRVSLQGLMC